MTNTNKELDKALGIFSQEDWGDVSDKYVPTIKSPDNYVRYGSKDTQPFIKKEEDIDNDYEYQRRNFYNLVERGTDAVEGILELAKESEHPRTYEVAGNLIKQVAEVTEKLGDLQEKMRKLKEVPNNAPKSVTNALFVGSTAELQKMIKDA